MNSYVLPKDIKYLLFDMDGTLVDTEPVGPQTFLNQLSKYGVKPTDDEYELFVKVWRRDGTDINENDYLSDIVKKYKLDITPDEYIGEFYSMYEKGIIEAAPLTGVHEFLNKTKESKRFKLAVVTASKASQVRAVLKKNGWDDVFDVIVAEEDISHHKPDPEPFIVGMNKLSAKSDECIILEDSKNGVLAGKSSGCLVIGLKIGNKKPQDLTQADIVLESLLDVSLD